MIIKNNKGFTLIEVMISLVCISLLFLMIMVFLSGQNRFALNLSENNQNYNKIVSDAEVLDFYANSINPIEVNIKIGVKTFDYLLKEYEYSDEENKFFLYNLKIR